MPDSVRQFLEDASVPKVWEANVVPTRQGDLPQLGSWKSREKPIAFLVWGDSHAMAIAELCNTLAKEYDIRGVVAAITGTAPVLGTWRPGRGQQAAGAWNQAVLEYVKGRGIPNVIMVSRWAVNIEGRPNGIMDTLIADQYSNGVSPEESKAALRRGLERTIVALKAEGVNVWVMKQVPLQAVDPKRAMLRAAFFGGHRPIGIRIEAHINRQTNVYDVMDSLRLSGAKILDPTDYCFDSSGLSMIEDGKRSFYADDDHLSKRGAEVLLRPLLEPVFKEIAAHVRGTKAQ